MFHLAETKCQTCVPGQFCCRRCSYLEGIVEADWSEVGGIGHIHWWGRREEGGGAGQDHNASQQGPSLQKNK